MVVITCPECGKVLDSEKIDFTAHCKRHWGVDERRLDTIQNETAKARYRTIIYALKEEVD
jgi:hypothetical protein